MQKAFLFLFLLWPIAAMPQQQVGPGGTSGSSGGGGNPNGPADNNTVNGRKLSNIRSDEFNVLDWGLKGDCTTDNASQLNVILANANAAGSALTNGKAKVTFPAGVSSSCYGLASSVAVPNFVELSGLGKATIRAIGATGVVFTMTNSHDITMRNLIIDGVKSVHAAVAYPIQLTNATGNILIEDVDIINPPGGFSLTTSYGVVLNRVSVNGSLQHGVIITTSYDNYVTNSQFQGEASFGIILTSGSYRNVIEHNRTTTNAIELVGVTQDSYENHINFNHSEGTGDNCISITGYKNEVIGNVGKGCAGNGIEVYGERNTVMGNILMNNNQSHGTNSGWRGGVAIQPGFGGLGQYNVVSGNIIDDDQVSPSTQYGVWVGATTYGAWITGTSYSTGVYVYYSGNLYKATTTGTSGATAPTWTNTQSDGGVTWQFIRATAAGTTSADYNEITGNVIKTVAISRYLDASGGTHTDYVGGQVPITLPSPLVVSQITNPGAVSSISLPSGSYSYANGTLPTINIGAPASGGVQATAHVASMFLLGYGNIATGGAGCSVNDILTFVGGTPSGGSAKAIRVSAVDGNGAMTTLAGSTGTFTYATLPPAGNTQLTGGTCTTEPTLSATSWHINTITVDVAGSNYTSTPTVTFNPSASPATSTVSLSSSMTFNAGNGILVMDGTGTKAGINGSGGAPFVSQGAMIDGSGVRQTLTSTYTVPANTSLVRFVQTGTLAASTVTLPTALFDGQPIQFVNYAGTITALTFSPAVTGFTNASSVAANTGIRIRWDATASSWQREQ